MPIPNRDRLIVALDVPSVEAAEGLVHRLGDAVGFYKIGLELAFAGGLGLAERLSGAGHKVFLDLKLHDIPNTVAGATAQVVRIGASFLTVHGYPQTMRAAMEAKRDAPLRILAVTALTSADNNDLGEAGYRFGAAELVAHRAAQAQALGVDGLVLSPMEVGAVRALVGPAMALVTPGIRASGTVTGDQKRVMRADDAIRAGADHLVVGRPITGAADPRLAAKAILAEIAAACESLAGA